MKWVLEQSIKSLVLDMVTLRCLVDIKGEMVRRQMDTGLEFGEKSGVEIHFCKSLQIDSIQTLVTT